MHAQMMIGKELFSLKSYLAFKFYLLAYNDWIEAKEIMARPDFDEI